MSKLTKFTDKVRGGVTGALRTGVSLGIAAEAAGISRMTLFRWLQQGERDEADGVDSEHARFLQDCRHAESKVIGAIEQSLMRAAASGDEWRAAAWVLSRKVPHIYSQDVTEAMKNHLCSEILDVVKIKRPQMYGELLELLVEDLPDGEL